MGRPVGTGNQNCFDNVSDDMVVDCRSGEDYCVTEMMADWDPKGYQVYRITRGCSATPAMEQCINGETSLIKYRDCFVGCENKDGKCNKGTDELYAKMSAQNVQECHGCAWEEIDDGTVNGNKKCDGELLSSEFIRECPRYAQESCFTGAAIHYDYGHDWRQIYKGCSTFKVNGIEGDGEEETIISLPDQNNNMAKYSITKSSCGKDGCNSKHKEPTNPENELATLCQVCSVTMDQFNKTIGVGQSDCWEGGNAAYQQDCGQGNYCSTEMEIDWLPRGQHQFRVIRGCSSTPPTTEQDCFEGSSRNGKFKDCKVTCDPRLSGNSCNNDLDAISDKFAQLVYMDYCYACELYENLDGSVNGNKNCPKFQLGSANFAGAMVCPRYAHASCYTASSIHIDYTETPDMPGQGNLIEDFFRGCSPFTTHNGDWWGKHCESSSINGFDHENCKELCFGPYCNFLERDPKPQCHVCSVTLDAEGNTVGTSDTDCFKDLSDSGANVVECAPNEPYCTDVMEIDWYSRGMQYVHFNRGCTREKVEPTCVDISTIGTVDANLRAKLCTGESCENANGPCNKDIKVADNFIPNGAGVKSCTTCSYSENDDGSVSGNRNCPENSADEMSMECPFYMSTACFVGSAKHNAADLLKDVTETYKGCSYFATDGVERRSDFIGGVAYKTVKETCDKDDCNKPIFNEP